MGGSGLAFDVSVSLPFPVSALWDSITSFAFWPVMPNHSGKKNATAMKMAVMMIKNIPSATMTSIPLS